MASLAPTLTYLFAVGTILLLLLVLVILVMRIATGRYVPHSGVPLVRRIALPLAAILAVFGSVMSLYYSEIVGYEPCVLCWFGRTMMYPLAVVLVVALVRRERAVWPYAFTLSIIGLLITGYHHLYQIGAVAGSLCSALGDGGECAKRYVYEFDMVTLPLMGVAMFASVALLVWIARHEHIA